ncbi:MAG: TRAP transporter permease [Deltaproteobacteria bacterium]|nr:TRAP transporter permease [Deltaproteobacteria bacterium]
MSSQRHLTGIIAKVAMVTAVAMTLFHLYYTTLGIMQMMYFRSFHVMFACVLIFLLYPISRKSSRSSVPWYDYLFAALTIAGGTYIIVEFESMVARLGIQTTRDVVFAIITISLVLEATRRTVGNALPILCLVFIAYAMFGHYLPDAIAHRGFSIQRITSQLYSTMEGIYGMTTKAMAVYVFLFIVFGAFLDASGAGNYFNDLAYSLTGSWRGGPAQTAVVASTLMGSVSGAAVANVVATGSFTIPLMKKVGYRPHEAGAIEAAASTGGQFMPPVMGSGIFIMSEWTGIPYFEIVKLAFLPALLYFFSVGVYVYIQANKMGLQPIPRSDLPPIGKTLLKGIHYMVPLIILVVVLLIGRTPTFAAVIGILSVIVISWFRRETRMYPRDIMRGLAMGARKAIAVSAACVASGVVVGVVGLTGIGLSFSSGVISLAGDSLILALLLVMGATGILGMGLPITAAYIVTAILAAPAMLKMGIPLLVAHMVIFWFSSIGNVTPPVCLAAYAGAGMAGADPMRTGFTAWNVAKGLYVIPFMMVYTPLMTGEPGPILLNTCLIALGLTAFTITLSRQLIRPLSLFQHAAFLGATIFLLFPINTITYGLGMALFLWGIVSDILKGREKISQTASA